MTRKILGLKAKKTQDFAPVVETLEDQYPNDPEKRFLNGVAIHPAPCIRLSSSSQAFSMRAMDLITP